MTEHAASDISPLAHAADDSFDAEFFLDPVCPWAWITSRWVTNITQVRPLKVHWNFISLRFINESKVEQSEYLQRTAPAHIRGLRLLRTMAAARASEGAAAVHPIYTEFGNVIHVQQAGPSLDDDANLAAAIERAGFSATLAKEADNDSWDATIRASTDLALSRTGKDVGTPIITYGPPLGPSLFGPVLSQAPKGDDAIKMWDALFLIASNPDFAELKRSLRHKPRFD